MNLDTLNLDELKQEVFQLAREQGVTDQSTWNELVDEVIDSHFDMAELNDDQDLQGQAESLYGAWEEYKAVERPESLEQIDEDPEAPGSGSK